MSALTNLKQQLNDLDQKKETLLPKQTAEHPELKGANLARAEGRDQIRNGAATSVKLMKGRATSYEEKERTLKGQIAAYREDLGQIPDREVSLGELDHEMQTLRDRYKELVGKQIQAKISQAT